MQHNIARSTNTHNHNHNHNHPTIMQHFHDDSTTASFLEHNAWQFVRAIAMIVRKPPVTSCC